MSRASHSSQILEGDKQGDPNRVVWLSNAFGNSRPSGCMGTCCAAGPTSVYLPLALSLRLHTLPRMPDLRSRDTVNFCPYSHSYHISRYLPRPITRLLQQCPFAQEHRCELLSINFLSIGSCRSCTTPISVSSSRRGVRVCIPCRR